jgi:hypothetical protein
MYRKERLEYQNKREDEMDYTFWRMRWSTIFTAHGTAMGWRGLFIEFFWLCRYGKFRVARNWPVLIFGCGRVWYDGPGWFVHCGLFSIDLWVD